MNRNYSAVTGGAMPLAAIDRSKCKPSSKLCKRHKFILSKYNRTCNRCGLVEEINQFKEFTLGDLRKA